MAQTVAVVNGTLTATGSGTTNFTSSGFGTPTAAIVIATRANSTNNPSDVSSVSIGFWDGTNQCVMGVYANDNTVTSDTYRFQRNDYILVDGGSSAWACGYQASAVTDGIRLTMAVDNTTVERYCTVILLKGVSAKVVTVTPNATQNGTAASPSLGFAPSAVVATCIGSGSTNTANSGSAQTSNAILTFGAAASGGTHRMVGWSSAGAAADATLNALFSETRLAGQVFSAALSWSAEVTTWGADTFTVTTRDGGSGSDSFYALALGGADLSLGLGTITTATSTGNSDVTTTGINPAAVLLAMTNLSSAGTVATDGTATGFAIGVSDGTTHGGYALTDEDAAATMNTASAYSSSNAVYSRTSASGTATDLVVGAVSVGTEKFTVNYTTADATARKGWFLAFGPAAGGSTYNVDISESNAITDAPTSAMLLAAAAAESTSAADSLADTATFSVAIVETNATADAVTAVSVLELAVSESASATDDQAATAELVADVAESTAVSDATDWGGAIYTMAVDESTSVADAVAAAVDFLAAQDESAAAGETLGLVCTFGVDVAESATVAEVYAAAADLVALLSETATAADTVAADPAGVINADIAETLAASDGWVAVLIRGFLVVTAPPRRALSGDGVRAANLNRGGRPRNLPGRGR